MEDRIDRVAALANLAAYDEAATRAYVDGAPHVKHASLRRLYGALAVEVFDRARRHAEVPLVLDLGAGEGSVTRSFLELGARVVAVDLSESQLARLRERCADFAERLHVRCEDIHEPLRREGERFDVIVASSFLHHVPDYLGLLRAAAERLAPHGQFFSFQDPLRYDTTGRGTKAFSAAAYLSWRILRGDVVGGLRRRARRARGVYLEDSPHDNAEYHITRNGMDQDAIRRQFEEMGFDCRIIRYFSTQNGLFQRMGDALGLQNTFGVLAVRRD